MRYSQKYEFVADFLVYVGRVSAFFIFSEFVSRLRPAIFSIVGLPLIRKTIDFAVVLLLPFTGDSVYILPYLNSLVNDFRNIFQSFFNFFQNDFECTIPRCSR